MYELGTVDCLTLLDLYCVPLPQFFSANYFIVFVVAVYMYCIFEVRDIIIFCLEVVFRSLMLSSNYRFTYCLNIILR